MTDIDCQLVSAKPSSGESESSMSECLHDGKVLSVRSDRHNRTVELLVDVRHIRIHHNLGEDQRFTITLQDVASVSVSNWSVEHLPWSEIALLPREEQIELGKQNARQARSESLSWLDFEAAFHSDYLDISNAKLLQHDDKVELQMEGFLITDDHDDDYRKVSMLAKDIVITQSPGIQITGDQFRKMGVEYWNAFGDRMTDVGRND